MSEVLEYRPGGEAVLITYPRYRGEGWGLLLLGEQKPLSLHQSCGEELPSPWG
jgi:hypothetical protein